MLKGRISKAARNYGFGGMVAPANEEMQQGINNFAAAHANTVATVNGLQQQNTQLGQMLQISQQQMAAMQMQTDKMQLAVMTTQPPQYNPPQYNNYGRRGGGSGGHGGRCVS